VKGESLFFKKKNRKREKLKTIKNKTIIPLIALLAVIIAIPSFISQTSAQTLQYYPSYVYVGSGPDPVGVGQQVSIVTWTAEIPPETPDDHKLGSFGNRQAWSDISITITDPNGKNETIKLGVTDPVGGTYYSFKPDIVGNYSVQAHFPAQWKNTTTYSRLYAASNSPSEIFTVTDEPLSWLSGVPLPVEYWTRPINAYNREWSKIAGNWLGDGRGNPYTTAPNTAHIAWTKPIQYGGIIGEPFEDVSYYEGTSYEQRFSHPIIIGGILFYTEPLGHKEYQSRDYNPVSGQSLVAVDIRTGEEIWRRDAAGAQKGTIYRYNTPNQDGAHAYLWHTSGSNSIAYDPFTGAIAFNVTNVPSGAEAVGPSGERLIYTIGGPATSRTWLALWNMSKMPTTTLLSTSQIEQLPNDPALSSNTNAWQWRPSTRAGQVHDGNTGYSWNVTLPAGLPGNVLFAFDNIIFGGTGFGSSGQSVFHDTYSIWAINTEQGKEGEVLWHIHPKAPTANVTLQFEGTMVTQETLDAGIILVRAKETMQWIAFDIKNGKQLWVTEPEPQWMMYSRSVGFSEDKLYSSGYGGQIFAYELATGKRVWTASIDTEGLESVYERAPLSGPTVVDGKVYVYTQEHSMTQPYYRTWKMYAFDAESGDRIWDITGAWRNPAVADGYLTSLNLFDMQVYAFGKGPTALTIDAPSTAINLGNSLVIRGSIIDKSAGATSSALSSRFPNGVPAIADENMTAWMEYVYMQMPKPKDITGVPVNLYVADTNGNYRLIGGTTTDENGYFSYAYKPDIAGKYTVYANFDGSESYWPSQAQSAFVVDDVETVTQEIPNVMMPPMEMYFVASTIAIIIAIAIVGLFILRKRP
jgi:outer membrane protein assembly factor BamB